LHFPGILPKNWKISQTDKDEVYHDWSPDGNWLAFDQYQDTVCRQYHIVLMNWETKESRILTDTQDRTQLASAFLKRQ
jgi:TolB protein